MATRRPSDGPQRRRRAPGGDDGTKKRSRGGLGFVSSSEEPASEIPKGYSNASFAAMFTRASTQDTIEPLEATEEKQQGHHTEATLNEISEDNQRENGNLTMQQDDVDDNEEESHPGLGLSALEQPKQGFSNADFASMFQHSFNEQEEKVDENAQDDVEMDKKEDEINEVKEVKKSSAPALPAVNIASMGKWEKHTKGFGMKMLAKMGFKGRLGKDEQGIAVPIAVKARPNQLGLGANGFKEATTLAQNRQVERELHGKTVEDEEEEARKAEIFGQDDGAWRKRLGAPKKRKRTARDILEAEPDEPKPSIVIDMRGPEAVKYTNGLSEVQIQTLVSAPILGQELLFNLRTLVNRAEGSIRDTQHRINAERARLHRLQSAANVTSESHHRDALAQENIAAIMTTLKIMHEKLPELMNPDAIELIADTLVSLQQKFPAEFESHSVIDALPSLTIPLLKTYSSNWHPLEEIDDFAISFRSCFDWIHNCLKKCVAAVEADTIGVFSSDIASETRHDRIFQHISKEILVPPVLSALYRWDAHYPCLQLIDFLDTFAHPLVVEHLLVEGVLPKLKQAVRMWNPRTDAIHLHEWLLPWANRFTKEQFHEPIFPLIRETMSCALAQWHPRDASIFSVLGPWKEVWSPEDFALFTHKSIVRKIIRSLNRELTVHPTDTNIEPLEWTLAWHNILPDRQLVALLEGEFFHKWLKVLHRWIEMANEAPEEERKVMITEIVMWFHGWKEFFQPVWHHERIRILFYAALQLLGCLGNTKAVLPNLNVLAVTYDAALVLGGKVKRQEVRKPVSSEAVHLREIVEGAAMEKGIEFVPHPKNYRIEGKLVYCFGKLHVYIDHELLHAEVTKGKYEPIDLDELVKRAS
ncbi:hypothetical protein THRCLA_00717 [Thraustotheca clavata]|uniref:G-patch domain-containing protein n=1 Tax=Thraustotheca clavata TaxID=74557 RepID=A0A1W0AAE3_9STRA|nr:hypothetical protein THRCLA_00717 [Thraustotheca clavata]